MTIEQDLRKEFVSTDVSEEAKKVLEEKTINEEYKLWKKNSPFLYDIMVSHALNWPSLTVEWLPDVEVINDRNYSLHRLLLGTHTSNTDNDYLQIANVHIPNANYDIDGEKYDEILGEAGGYGNNGLSSESKLNIVQKIPHEGEVNRARYMPGNQNIIATRTTQGDVLIFDRTKHESIPQLDAVCNPEIRLVGHDQEGYGTSWNQNKQGFLLTGGADQKILEWDINSYSKQKSTLEPINQYLGHTDYVEDVEYSPLIETLFGSVGDDQKLMIWDTRVNKNAPIFNIHAHQAEINCLSWNPKQSNLILTGSSDKSISLWDTRNTKYSLHTFVSHQDEILQVKWSPFSDTIFGSSGSDRRINIWDISRVGEEQAPEDIDDGPSELLFVHGGHCDKVADFSWNLNESFLIASVAEDNICQIWQMANNIRFNDLPTIDDNSLE